MNQLFLAIPFHLEGEDWSRDHGSNDDERDE
jgi:hypothetical protein